jgi:VWFA-related protein
MRASRGICLASAAVLTAFVSARTAAGQSFTDTTRVTAVQIPVQVVADGKPVRGLTAADFAVYEGRRQRPVVGFDTIDLQTLPQGAEVPSAARRYFMMIFDLAFSEPHGIARAREAAISMLPQLHPSDLVAVATYRRSTGIDVILGFTSDRGQIRVALDSLGLPEMIDRASDPLKLVVVEHDPYDFGETEGVGGEGPKEREPRRILPPRPVGTQDPNTIRLSLRFSGLLNPMFKAKQEEEAMKRESQKAAVDALADSFAELARLLRSVSGRKEVLFFSEGFNSALIQGNAETEEQQRVYVEGSEAGAIWRVDSEDRFGSTQAAGDLERMLEELRRSDCRVHTIDLSGLRDVNDLAQTGNRGGRDSLFQIAHDTGGELYENFNNLSAAVGKMLERTGVTYVLTIQPEDLASDGSYHPLRVELRRGAASKGARVVHRPGYFSPRPFAERGKADREMLTSSRLLTGDEPGPVPMAVIATPYPKDGEMAWVPVLVEADGPALLADNGPGDLLAEIYIYALDEQGAVRGYVAQALSLELARVEADLRRGGLRFLGHLELPPGRFNLRILALNGRTGAYGLRVARVEVPEMGAGKPVLLQPIFPKPPGQGVVTREATVDGREIPFPFTQGPISYLPDPRPVLRSGEEAPVALVGYHLPAGDLRIRTAVLTADGREVAAGGLRVLGREGGPDGSDRLRAAFRPPGLAPGEYLLRVTVTGEGAERASTAPFTIEKAPGGP